MGHLRTAIIAVTLTLFPAIILAQGAKEAALFRAVKGGDPTKVRAFIEGGMDIETLTDDRLTPLLVAVRSGRAGVVETLVSLGADVNARSSYMWYPDSAISPLLLAADLGNADIVAYLLDHGADIHATTALGTTATMLGAGAAAPSVVALLLDRGAEVAAV